MDILINGLLLGGSVCWILGGMFALYTSVRDDIRNERTRKEEKHNGIFNIILAIFFSTIVAQFVIRTFVDLYFEIKDKMKP